MRVITKQVDMNAHIEDLKCEIHVESGNAIAQISFMNLGGGDITAIKFNARSYNPFGDVVPVNGKENFFLIIQDMVIPKNQTANGLKAKLPNADIRKLDLEECQICYADGSVVSYEGKRILTYEIEEFDRNADKEQLRALQKMYDEHIQYKIRDFDEGWFCGCGRFNRQKECVCSLCGKRKTDTIYASSEEGLKRLIEKMHDTDRQEEEAEKERAKQRARKKRRKGIAIAAGSVCVAALVAFCVNLSVLSKRQIFRSEDDMRSVMQGNWSHYGYNDEVLWQIQIDGDTCTQIYDSFDHSFEREITWHPSRGTFEVFGRKYVIHKGGNRLTEGRYEYERGGFLQK